jgi:hypothetical protein
MVDFVAAVNRNLDLGLIINNHAGCSGRAA